MIPLVLVATMDPVVRDISGGALLVDLPGAALLRHDVIPANGSAGGRVRRLVTDAGGIVEDRTTELGHACLSCAVREDLVPTLQRMIDSGRWSAIIVALPVTGAPEPVAFEIDGAIAEEELAARLACVLSVIDPTRLLEDLFGDDLLADRGQAIGARDNRSVGEALSSQLEYADTVCCLGPPQAAEAAVLDQLIGPTSFWRPALHELSAARLVENQHDVDLARERVDPVLVRSSRAEPAEDIWTLELTSPRPFHPLRLMEQLELLGSGQVRGRGCFWLPTRPGQICAWDGAGGQLAIGSAGQWRQRTPLTRLLITGIDPTERGRIARAFADVLLTDFEVRRMGEWLGRADPFEPWLGEVTERGAG